VKIERVGFLDLAAISAQQNTCLVLPTLRHANSLWIRYREFVAERHTNVERTKTILIMRDSHTYLRLWVPYEREPTSPMDWEMKRNPYGLGYVFVSPYGGRI